MPALSSLEPNQPNNWLTLLNATFTIASAGFGLWARRRNALIQMENLRLHLDRQRIAWGSEVIELLSETEFLVERLHRGPRDASAAQGAEMQREAFLARLSSLIDRGRMYFPNVLSRNIGQERGPAFAGHRRAIIDAIALVYETVKRMKPELALDNLGPPGDFVRECRRAFVSELQTAIGKRRLSVLISDEADGAGDDPLTLVPNWKQVTPLVDRFETTFGAGCFWKDRPPSEEPSSKAAWHTRVWERLRK